jgi:S-adenosylmethionine:tRNA ribosyltransferase-isomerase
MHPGEINIKDYSFDLPEEKIAQFPLANRDESKILVYNNGSIQESIYKNLSEFLPSDSCLVFNNTRVVQARLKFKTQTGSEIELFCLEPHESEIAVAMSTCGQVVWKCFVGRIKKWKEKKLSITQNGITLTAELKGQSGDSYLIQFNWNEDKNFAEILLEFGKIPIPPYLKRNADESDVNRYQTVYARQDGSVAAPTAGLHFTPYVFDQLNNKNISPLYITLHVGAGTFKPVKSEKLMQHPMHAEWMVIPLTFLENLLVQSCIICVGTTSLRTLESIYWMGVKAHLNPACSHSDITIHQWDPYELPSLEVSASIKALIDWMKKNELEVLNIKTSILIAPGYSIKMVKGIITNFHQPESTLILLIAACIGNDWRKVYQYALQHDFRFLSYGDGSLLFIS